ncbi:dehydrodolichyl diphosphate synthase complex subunit NUS1 [Drosophila eugracilis]|uniref:dehydrodolichyl diphosphate synthase complex subunit NUS1 n=1 Tax=Drosophila eugracilis TaxID=29029 RepID=UPI0007E6134D|nr:dehydrodolichyl diphosphate synthase complex subunit NUS1 [Drosophila eugracilis]XP_017063255.1 dehydrodolichyl diphosphate synthase complex subunit NUS1 [Drosophila eugracilis]XP_017063256.1 dehydrodolichyl diphosphate synthase complex subunit NUS1 [Drosophila eugracilis]
MIEVLCLLLSRILLLLIGGYELIWRFREHLNALVVRWSYDLWRSGTAREHHERRVLAECRSQLTKTPQHLVLVISPMDTNVDSVLLRKIFDFALDMGIKHVSLYDRRTKGKGYVELTALCRSSNEDQGSCLKWPPSPIPCKAENQPKNGQKTNGYVNGANGSYSPQLQLYQISASDGHALIADVCRELYEGRETPMVQNLLKQKREALTEQITGMLNKRLGFDAPDPDLGIVFARQTCTYGLLPWHVRFTEFHTHPSGRHFDVETFANILSKYSRCEQRWGT